jgi:hypothetical protein
MTRLSLRKVLFLAAGISVLGLATPLDGSASGTAVLKVSPTSVYAPGDGAGCTANPSNNQWTCHVTVSETKASSKSLNWSAVGDSATTITPSSGSLSPGQHVHVTIVTTDCGGYFHWKFVGPQNTVGVRYQCG